MFLIDLKNKKVDGSRLQILLDHCKIYINKNTVPGDKNPMNPGGVRLGSTCMTSRGLVEKDFEQIAQFIDRGV